LGKKLHYHLLVTMPSKNANSRSEIWIPSDKWFLGPKQVSPKNIKSSQFSNSAIFCTAHPRAKYKNRHTDQQTMLRSTPVLQMLPIYY